MSRLTGIKMCKPWAPPLYDTGEESLFGVICNIGCETVNDSSEMTICAANDLWGCHSRFEAVKNFGKRRMKKLSSKFSKFGIIHVGFVGCVVLVDCKFLKEK